MFIYAFDIGGSSIKHGLIKIDEHSNIEIISKSTTELSTNKFEELKEKVMYIISMALKNENPFNAIGISTTGSVNTDNVVVSAGHFDGYQNISWEALIKSEFPSIKSVATINDGRASTWAEYISNEKKPKSHIHVVVGTGVGGGIVHDNTLLLGDSGQAGYIGHMKITQQDTITCSCGKTGCLETLASSRGIVQHYITDSKQDESTDFHNVLQQARANNINAINAISRGGYWLGIGIGNCMNILNPSIVTIGGGVVLGTTDLINFINQDIYYDSVIKGIEFASHKRVFASCKIQKATYGNDSGLIGAAHLSYERIKLL